MSQQVDYDEQFQKDLDTAMALSMEQKELDDLRRKKKYGYTSQAVPTSRRPSYQAPPPPSISQRTSDSVRTRPAENAQTPRPSVQTEDLISFPDYSPTAKSAINADINKFIQELPTLQAASQQTVLQPMGAANTAAAVPPPLYIPPPSMSGPYGTNGSGSVSSGSGGGQMVLFVPPPQQQKPVLNNEELNRLYSQSQQPQHYMYYTNPNHIGFIAPYPQTAPIMNAAALGPNAYMQQPTPMSNSVPSLTIPPQTYRYPVYGIGANINQNNTTVLPPPISTNLNRTQSGLTGLRMDSNNPNNPNIAVVNRNENTVPLRRSGPAPPPSDGNLIDLGPKDDCRVSVLEAFDPLLNDDFTTTYAPSSIDYDIINYLYNGGSSQYSDPVYDAVNRLGETNTTTYSDGTTIGWRTDYMAKNEEQSKPIDDERASTSTAGASSSTTVKVQSSSSFGHRSAPFKPATVDRRNVCTRLYDIVVNQPTIDPELLEFYEMVKELRSLYCYDDETTNVGHIVAAEYDYFRRNTSVKIYVYPALNILKPNAESNLGTRSTVNGYGTPVVFTSDIDRPVSVVIHQAYTNLIDQILPSSSTDYVLKPIGLSEWLSPDSKLYQLECVHNSLKLECDVQLGLCLKSDVNMKALARTQSDDARVAELRPENIIPNEMANIISYNNIKILLEFIEMEIDKLESAAADINSRSVLSCSGVEQTVKNLCITFGSIDTLEINACIKELRSICDVHSTTHFRANKSNDNINSNSNSGNNNNYSNIPGSPEVIHDYGDYAEINIRPRSVVEQVKLKCSRLRDAVEELIELYSHVFRVGFAVNVISYPQEPLPISCVSHSVMVTVNCLYRPPVNWSHYSEYTLGVQIYHGTRYISDVKLIKCTNDTSGGLCPSLKFSSWILFDKNQVCSLPLESRLTFVLIGFESSDTNKETNTHEKKHTELGWCAIQLFDYKREMICGPYLLSMWPPTAERRLGPAPARGCHPQPDTCPVLSIEMPPYGGTVQFPKEIERASVKRFDFKLLDPHAQQDLLDTVEQGYNGEVPKREILWEKRHYMQSIPKALPKVLYAAHNWDCDSVKDLYSLLYSWDPLSPLQALELLLPPFSDAVVREKAVMWISELPNDELVDHLPQLLQALKHDTYEASPMARFLLCKCLESPRIAHQMYWLLIHSLPGDCPQNSIDDTSGPLESREFLITQARYYRRNKIMLRALLEICGENLLTRFLSQNLMCTNLTNAAEAVKESKESQRQKVLENHMHIVNECLQRKPTSLPLGPQLEVNGVYDGGCSYFISNTLPLKISFRGPDSEFIPAIFKVGDDLQQDMLTIQLIRMMNKMWLAEGFDLKIITFNCVPTGYRKGIIECVTNAETLKKIHADDGLVTGPLKDSIIAEWLRKHNPSELEYERAVNNFTVSTAGYCVATFLLGICDRHNDNIMVKKTGHLFHIDFGKFLGDAQKFGNFKRDRAPFVLTSDMAYVITNGNKEPQRFQSFVDYCCQAYNIIRKNGDVILHMLTHLATAGIPGVTSNAVTYVQQTLMLHLSNKKAEDVFTQKIRDSLGNWFTPINFVLHNIAQWPFKNNENNDEFSFVSRKYTMQEDGRLKSVQVVRCQKHYDTEKYYMYILCVRRHNQRDPSYLFRSYKQFEELYQKLTNAFPRVKFYSLSKGYYMGRSNIKSVAERRVVEISQFLRSLFDCSDEIAHCDYVYTFFHPLLKDQQKPNLEVSKVKETADQERENAYEVGELQISVQYQRGTLTVMIRHAKGLPMLPGNQKPNTYVKCYLKPDSTKMTKRKTRVVRKTCVPSFMEALEYRMPIEIVRNRILHVTVWTHDTLQEKELLGGFTIDLSQHDLNREYNEWFRLGPMPRH